MVLPPPGDDSRRRIQIAFDDREEKAKELSEEFVTQQLIHKGKLDSKIAARIAEVLDIEDGVEDDQVDFHQLNLGDAITVAEKLAPVIGELDHKGSAVGVAPGVGYSRSDAVSSHRTLFARNVDRFLTEHGFVEGRSLDEIVQAVDDSLGVVSNNYPQYLSRQTYFQDRIGEDESDYSSQAAMAAGAAAFAIPSRELNVINQFEQIEKALQRVAHELDSAIRLAEGELPMFPTTDPNFPWLDENLAREGDQVRDQLYKLREELKRVTAEVADIRRAAETLHQNPKKLVETLKKVKSLVSNLVGSEIGGVLEDLSPELDRSRHMREAFSDALTETFSPEEQIWEDKTQAEVKDKRKPSEAKTAADADSVPKETNKPAVSVDPENPKEITEASKNSNKYKDTEKLSDAKTLDSTEVNPDKVKDGSKSSDVKTLDDGQVDLDKAKDASKTPGVEGDQVKSAPDIESKAGEAKDGAKIGKSKVRPKGKLREIPIKEVEKLLQEIDAASREATNVFLDAAHNRFGLKTGSVTGDISDIAKMLFDHNEALNEFDYLVERMGDIQTKKDAVKYLKEGLAHNLEVATDIPENLVGILRKFQAKHFPDNPRWLTETLSEIRRNLAGQYLRNIGIPQSRIAGIVQDLDLPKDIKKLGKLVKDDYLKHVFQIDDIDQIKKFLRDLHIPKKLRKFKRKILANFLEEKWNIKDDKAKELLKRYGKSVDDVKRSVRDFIKARYSSQINGMINHISTRLGRVPRVGREILEIACRAPRTLPLARAVASARDWMRISSIEDAIEPVVGRARYAAGRTARTGARLVEGALDAAQHTSGRTKAVAATVALVGAAFVFYDDVDKMMDDQREARISGRVYQINRRIDLLNAASKKDPEDEGIYKRNWYEAKKKKYEGLSEEEIKELRNSSEQEEIAYRVFLLVEEDVNSESPYVKLDQKFSAMNSDQLAAHLMTPHGVVEYFIYQSLTAYHHELNKRRREEIPAVDKAMQAEKFRQEWEKQESAVKAALFDGEIDFHSKAAYRDLAREQILRGLSSEEVETAYQLGVIDPKKLSASEKAILAEKTLEFMFIEKKLSKEEVVNRLILMMTTGYFYLHGLPHEKREIRLLIIKKINRDQYEAALERGNIIYDYLLEAESEMIDEKFGKAPKEESQLTKNTKDQPSKYVQKEFIPLSYKPNINDELRREYLTGVQNYYDFLIGIANSEMTDKDELNRATADFHTQPEQERFLLLSLLTREQILNLIDLGVIVPDLLSEEEMDVVQSKEF